MCRDRVCLSLYIIVTISISLIAVTLVDLFLSHRRRRQSLRNIPGFGMIRHQDPAPRQTLHIFVSNLKCSFFKRKYQTEKEPSTSAIKLSSPKFQDKILLPDPFVAFLSYPKRLVKEERSLRQKVAGFFNGPADLRTKSNDDGTISRTAGGWPRTKRLISTMDPDWSDEGEIHLKVMSHDKHGVPLDATGAVLYFSAFNAASLDLTMIGTFAMNLGMLCAKANSARRGDLTERSSVYLKNEAISNMTWFEIDQPLLKNGRETGRITCDIDASWLDDAVRSTVNLKNMKAGRKQEHS